MLIYLFFQFWVKINFKLILEIFMVSVFFLRIIKIRTRIKFIIRI